MRTAIVTGASGGLGTEFVRLLTDRDAVDSIWAVGRNREKLLRLRDVFGGKVEPVAADLCSPEGLEEIRKKLEDEKPQVTYLINNAGIAKMDGSVSFTCEEIDRTVDTNVKAPVKLINMAMEYMGRGSRILNISSSSAFQPVPYINLYGSSKVFLRNYTRALNAELRNTGITATAVCPGWIDTPMLPDEVNGQKVRYPALVQADRVAARALKDADRGRDMSVCTLYVKLQRVFTKLAPQKAVMRIWLGWIRRYGFGN